MKTVTAALALFVSVALVAGTALAFTCPLLVKGANEAIAKAEQTAAKTTDDRQKLRNGGLLDEAKELSKAAEAAHTAGNHARAEAKAYAAKLIAELVK